MSLPRLIDRARSALRHRLQGASAPVQLSAAAAAVAMLGGLAFTVFADASDAPLQAATAPATATALLATAPSGGTQLAPLRTANPAAVLTSAPAPQAAPQIAEMPADFIPANAEGSTDNAPFGRIFLPALSNGQQAIDALGRDLPAVAAWYGKSSGELAELLRTDATVYVDRKGRLLFVDSGVPPVAASMNADTHASASAARPAVMEAGDVATVGVPSTSGAPFPLDQTFALHSRSSSSRVIFLNFKGEGSKPAFSLDKVPGTFNDAEKAMIQKIWLRVAEDYSPFDVDITTEAPASVTGKTGVTILITNQTSDAGGYAYLNSFSALKVSPAPAFCFQNKLANAEKPIAECVSHELGHTLGLHHQSTASVTYYGGAGDGETGWAPIMGVSYYKNLTQWAKGEYAGATNTEDAYAVMKKQGLAPRADDHGNTADKADPLVRKETNGLANLSSTGVIETPTDVDVFSFVAGAGDLNLAVTPSNWSGNLDVALELRDAGGKTLGTSNPATTLGASITTRITTPGTYYLFVKGTGKGDPRNGGYSNYGSIGQYSVTGTAALTVR